MRLSDRVAIVTGAQQGIGKAIALGYAREGAGVVVNFLDDAGGAEAIVAQITAAGGRARAVQGDVAVAEEVARMVEAAEALGGVDLLVNNAGIFPGGAIVNIASVVVNTGAPNGVHYAASKAGLVGLTRAAAAAISSSLMP